MEFKHDLQDSKETMWFWNWASVDAEKAFELARGQLSALVNGGWPMRALTQVALCTVRPRIKKGDGQCDGRLRPCWQAAKEVQRKGQGTHAVRSRPRGP